MCREGVPDTRFVSHRVVAVYNVVLNICEALPSDITDSHCT